MNDNRRGTTRGNGCHICRHEHWILLSYQEIKILTVLLVTQILIYTELCYYEHIRSDAISSW